MPAVAETEHASPYISYFGRATLSREVDLGGRFTARVATKPGKLEAS